MTALTIPDMTGWSVLDYEMAIDGIRQINDATIWLQNQPRAYGSDRSFHPGAEFIVALGEEWCGEVLRQIFARLEAIRFPSPKDEDRRIRLLIIYAAWYGEVGQPIDEILKMIEEQRAPAAA